MKYLTFITAVSFLLAMSISEIAIAQPCPVSDTDTLDPAGDWDRDGLVNKDDPCCFVASVPGDTTDAMCSDTDGNRDRNGNGIPAEQEGECCVTYHNGHCWQIPAYDCTMYMGGVPVQCDDLLWYGTYDSDCTGFDDCICFTVGDYDSDGNTVEDIGPFDNCPEKATEENEQSNSDADEPDIWGDACDFCPHAKDEAAECGPGAQQCTPPGKCVLFAFEREEENGVEVRRFCSFSPDKDGDKIGDACEECPEDPGKVEPGVCGCGVPDADEDSDDKLDCEDECPKDPEKIAPGECGCGTPDSNLDSDDKPDCKDECPDDPEKTAPGLCGCGSSDGDRDSDSVPDCGDRCPDDPNKIEPGRKGCGNPENGDRDFEDKDGDEVPDSEDNCPYDYNPEQDDWNEDGIGDKCTELADDYTGAFTCDCSAPGNFPGPVRLLVSLLSFF